MRGDGQTQHRLVIDSDVVAEYAALMRAGVEFPPVRLWWDGMYYWLTDGFHRVAAGRDAGLTQLQAEVCLGTRSDAQWDSYAANSAHGIRRTADETQRVIRLALQHPNADNMSNVQIANHLHISEPTLRRWRKRLSSSNDEDKMRVVTRTGTTYLLRTANIGCKCGTRRNKSRGELRAELASMKKLSSPVVRRLLNIVGNWSLGHATPTACLDALERIAANWTTLATMPDSLDNEEVFRDDSFV